jgi:ABC-type bacteriocin/lantibiotic exporter with double-glycine peptidase domain
MQNLSADLNRLDDLLDNQVDPETGRTWSTNPSLPCGDSSVRLRGALEFRNVSFGYSPLASPLIENLSFTVEPGRRVALVGDSGSGKSTVARLAAGIYTPLGGEVLVDDRPRACIDRDVLASSVAMVDQEILTFEGSVKDNLTLWDATASESSITDACRDALLHDVIAAWPHGYHEELQEAGANMSGGEKQRLEIARALVNSPVLLILDEATSALDAETERLILRNLRRRACSCLIVAHRLSTIRDCDEILVLRDGKVVQRGRHEELLNEGGEYARLLSLDDSSLLEAA